MADDDPLSAAQLTALKTAAHWVIDNPGAIGNTGFCDNIPTRYIYGLSFEILAYFTAGQPNGRIDAAPTPVGQRITQAAVQTVRDRAIARRTRLDAQGKPAPQHMDGIDPDLILRVVAAMERIRGQTF